MKGLATAIPRALPVGAYLTCDDNSGAKVVQIIGALRYKGTRGRIPSVGITDVAIVSVKKGSPQMIKKVERAVIIRQKRAILRANGLRVMFEDNACALIDETGLPKGTEIKGTMAREVAEKFPKVASIAWGIV